MKNKLIIQTLIILSVFFSILTPATNAYIDPRLTPVPTGLENYHSIWGTSDSDVFIAGDMGIIMHFDGTKWERMESGTYESLYMIWGPPAQSSPVSDVFAVGDSGTILHYDKTGWSHMDSGTDASLLGLWGSSGSDMFVVGDRGTILHYDGTEWSPVKSPTHSRLYNVWGSSGSDVFAVGNSGTILHYDGNKWEPTDSGSTGALRGIWGNSSSDVFVTSYRGEVLHYDGRKWSLQNDTGYFTQNIWGISRIDVYAVGNNGVILHYDGTEWAEIELTENGSRTKNKLRSIWGSSASNVFAVGHSGIILHYDGKKWSSMAGSPHSGDVTDVWGRSASDFFIGSEVLHYDGKTWTDTGAEQEVWKIWGTPDDVFAGTNSGRVLHYDGSVWTSLMSDIFSYVETGWAVSASDIFVSGDKSFWHFNGSSWTKMHEFDSVRLNRTNLHLRSWTNVYEWDGVNSMWGSSGTDVFAVGYEGKILHYDGIAWTKMESSTEKELFGIWGSSGTEVFAVGRNGTILHYDGTAWTEMESGIDDILRDVWGSSGTDVFAVSSGGIILHYDGSEWISVWESDTIKRITDVWVSQAEGESELFVGRAMDGVVRYRYTALTLTLPKSISEGDHQTHRGEVRINTAPAHDLLVKLVSGDSSEITVQETVIIPAGETSAAFDITVKDDNFADGTKETPVIASADGCFSGRGTVPVYDNETAAVMLTIPRTAREGDDRITGKVAICRNEDGTSCVPLTAAEDITVRLRSDDTTEIAVPVRVTVPAGASSAVFEISVVDDTDIDDTKTAGISAWIEEWSPATSLVSVSDNDRYVISLYLPEDISEGDGIIFGTIFLSEPQSSDVTIALSSDNTAELTVPPSLMVPAGETKADFRIKVMEDALPDGDKNITVNAAAPGWITGSTAVTVKDGDTKEIVMRRSGYFKAIWGNSGDDVFVVGNVGNEEIIIHYDGTAWTDENWYMGESFFDDIWGSSENDIFIVAGYANILHYDGRTWTKMKTSTDEWFSGIWGSSGIDVFAVGYKGTILHYNGEAWAKMESSTTEALFCVWGSSETDVFATGDGGLILHYDGRVWTKMESGTGESLSGIWGGSGTNIFVAGASGTILHYDGMIWTEMENITDQFLTDIWGSSGTDVFAVGHQGTILHYDGTAWTRAENLTEFIQFNDIWCEPWKPGSKSAAYAVGENGTILHYEGMSWEKTATGTDWHMHLNGVWGRQSRILNSKDDSEIFAVGELGTVLYYNGKDWYKVENITANTLNAVWGSSVSDVYAVGDRGTALHYDGSQWILMETGMDKSLMGVWVSRSGSDIFAVGEEGIILHYSHGIWEQMESGTREKLNSVWGYQDENSSLLQVFAVGENDTILHYNGSAWNQMETDIIFNDLYKVWGRSASDVFAVGRNEVLHYDGKEWSFTKALNYKGISGNSRGDIFMAGNNSMITRQSSFQITVPLNSSEDAGVLGGTVSIPRPQDTDLTVCLTSLDPSEVMVPETVLIPAGEISAIFALTINDDALADGTQTVPILATAPDHEFLNGGRAEIRITDNENAVLSLSLPENADEGGKITGFVSMSEPAGKDVTVSLGDTFITILKGETSAEFTLHINEDNEFDSNRIAVVTASVENWTSATVSVPVSDNEIHKLSLSIPETASENSGILTGTVSIPGTFPENLKIMLASDDLLEIKTPESILIPAGEMSASFNLTIIDDPDIDGTQTVNLTASAHGWTSAETLVEITDNDPGILQFSKERYTALENSGTAEIKVIRTKSADGEISVQLSVVNEQLSESIAYDILMLGSGETEKIFTLPLGTETGNFRLTLENPEGGAELIEPYLADLIITDRAEWKMQTSLTNAPLKGIWGSSCDNIFTVGWGGTALHYNGTAWNPVSHEAGNFVFFEDIWGSSATDIYIVGQSGVILHYDGTAWTASESPTSESLYAIWGSSANNVFVGGSGLILHYNGLSWTQMNTETDLPPHINDIWGTSSSDIFAAGYDGIILHYDGKQWTQMNSSVYNHLFSIWGTSPTNVFGAGDRGIILHYDGKQWTPMNTGTDEYIPFLESLWGSSPENIYAAGAFGTLLHFDGKKWSPAVIDTDTSLNALWGTSDLDIFVAGENGTILHYGPSE